MEHLIENDRDLNEPVDPTVSDSFKAALKWYMERSSTGVKAVDEAAGGYGFGDWWHIDGPRDAANLLALTLAGHAAMTSGRTTVWQPTGSCLDLQVRTYAAAMHQDLSYGSKDPFTGRDALVAAARAGDLRALGVESSRESIQSALAWGNPVILDADLTPSLISEAFSGSMTTRQRTMADGRDWSTPVLLRAVASRGKLVITTSSTDSVDQVKEWNELPDWTVRMEDIRASPFDGKNLDSLRMTIGRAPHQTTLIGVRCGTHLLVGRSE